MGGARTAIFNWLFAKRHGGEMILRIEDTDQDRSTRESEKTVLEDLRWLGLDWAEGPLVGGPYGPYRQSERLERYADVAGQLVSRRAAYRCYCTSEELEEKKEKARAEGRPPHYDGTCRELDGESADRRAPDPHVIRFGVSREGGAGDVSIDDLVRGPVEWRHDSLGDFIILRQDGMPTYNFAVVVDDHDMLITHVIRGEEHLTNTHRQVLIYRAMEWEVPEFAHVSLILGEDRSKLSKRHGSVSLGAFAESGILPEALANYLTLLGWSHPQGIEKFSMEEAARVFEMDRISPSPAVFDRTKLEWLNGEYLAEWTHEQIAGAIFDELVESRGIATSPETRSWVIDAVELVRGGATSLGAIASQLGFFFDWDVRVALSNPEVLETIRSEGARSVVTSLMEDLEQHGPPRDVEEFQEMASRVKEASGGKGKGLFMPLRIALTGQAHGPELKFAVPLLSRGGSIEGLPVVGPVERVREMIGVGAMERSAD